MEWLVWTGTAITLLGVGLLFYCILRVIRARRAGLDDAALKTRLQSVVALNLGALAISAIGLMCVILGLFLN
ncbi:MAG: hypothetical protein QNJ13_05665 [Paracoccaceae bacterium]|nr:hypothetical protein [Paracoccaceae bacterium]